jgi:hypothetical protein
MHNKSLIVSLISIALASCGDSSERSKSMEFIKEATLPDNISQPTVTLLQNGNLLLNGGCVEFSEDNRCITASNKSFIIDSSSGDIVPVSTMSESRYQANSVLLNNGNVLIYGNNINGANNSATYEVFNTPTKTYDLSGNMSEIRDGGEAVAIDDKAYIIGGYGGLIGGKGIEVYDSTTNSMYLADARLNTGLAFRYSVKLPNNKILIAGGFFRGQGIKSTVKNSYVYSPDTDSIIRSEDFFEPIANNSSNHLPSRYFDVGNNNVCVYLKTIHKSYLYNYNTNKWGTLCLSSGYTPDGYMNGKYIHIGLPNQVYYDEADSYTPDLGDGPGISDVISLTADRVTGMSVKSDNIYDDNCNCYIHEATSFVTYKLLAPNKENK